MSVAREENASISSVGIRSISRTGRRPSRPGRSTNTTPSRACSSSSIAVVYVSDALTAAACSTLPSIERHLPSDPCTLFATAAWVCRFGSPLRLSRWSKHAMTRPRVSIWATPAAPCRVNAACRSRYPRARATAAACASSTATRVAWSPNAHSTDTLLTGVNTRSYPATGCRAGRAWAAMNCRSSATSIGSRPCSRRNRSRPTSRRTRARSSWDSSPTRTPSSRARSALPAISASRHPVPAVSSNRGNARPSLAARMAASGRFPSAIQAAMIRSASGCRPSPNSAFICASDTAPDTPRPASPAPAHRPGGLPCRV
jgi:hypothetical protein